MPTGEAKRRYAPSDGIDRRGRRPRHRHAPLRARRSHEARGARSCCDPRFSRWPRHDAQVGAWVYAAAFRLRPEDRLSSKDCEHLGSLLRDGSRPTVGPYGARVPGDRSGRGHTCHRSARCNSQSLRIRKDRRIHATGGRDREWKGGGADERWRRRHLLQLPVGQNAADRARADRAEFRWVRRFTSA